MHISLMTADDIGFAISLTDIEGWGNIAADFERLIYFEPEGCFIARDKDDRVGMISTTACGDYAFIGSLIVKSEYRRRGIAETLMHHAMSYLHKRGVSCIELDATFQGVPLYRKLGFKDKYLSLRLMRKADLGQAEIPHISAYSADDIISFDKKMTGLDRRAILSRFIDEFDNSVYLSGTGRIDGYGLVTPRAGNIRAIGPIVAGSETVAQKLIDEIVRKNAGHDIGIGLPGTAPHEITSILMGHRFEYLAPSLRMYFGQRLEYESGVYAILSPAKG